MNYLKKLYFTIFTFLICSSINSQISKPGVPYSFKNNNNLSLTSYQISKPSGSELISAIVDNRQAYCIGILKSTDLSLSKNGTWTQNRDGSRSCYLKIKSAGAKGLSVYFKNFIIPEGAELFVYNENIKCKCF